MPETKLSVKELLEKITPGVLSVRYGNDPRDFIVADETGNTVCETNFALFLDNFVELDPSVRPITLEESKANAELFSRAPALARSHEAMYDALNDLAQSACDIVVCGPSPERLEALKRDHETAMLALAEAEKVSQ